MCIHIQTADLPLCKRTQLGKCPKLESVYTTKSELSQQSPQLGKCPQLESVYKQMRAVAIEYMCKQKRCNRVLSWVKVPSLRASTNPMGDFAKG